MAIARATTITVREVRFIKLLPDLSDEYSRNRSREDCGSVREARAACVVKRQPGRSSNSRYPPEPDEAPDVLEGLAKIMVPQGHDERQKSARYNRIQCAVECCLRP